LAIKLHAIDAALTSDVRAVEWEALHNTPETRNLPPSVWGIRCRREARGVPRETTWHRRHSAYYKAKSFPSSEHLNFPHVSDKAKVTHCVWNGLITTISKSCSHLASNSALRGGWSLD